MSAFRPGILGAGAAAGAMMLLSGCTTEDLNAFAEGMAVAADEMSVTMAAVPAYGCDYNVDGYLVCDDTGDGFADRYGDPSYEYAGYTAYGVSAYNPYGTAYGAPYGVAPVGMPAPRVNEYGEAYVFDNDCACWVREPSLDELPDDYGRHHHHREEDDWDD